MVTVTGPGVDCTISSTTVWLAVFRNVVYCEVPELTTVVIVTLTKDELDEGIIELVADPVAELVETADEETDDNVNDGADDEDGLLLVSSADVRVVTLLVKALSIRGVLVPASILVEFKIAGGEGVMSEVIGVEEFVAPGRGELSIDVAETRGGAMNDVAEVEELEVTGKEAIIDAAEVDTFEKKGVEVRLAMLGGKSGIEPPLATLEGTMEGEVIDWDEDWGLGRLRIGLSTALVEEGSVRLVVPPVAEAPVSGRVDGLLLGSSDEVELKGANIPFGFASKYPGQVETRYCQSWCLSNEQ